MSSLRTAAETFEKIRQQVERTVLPLLSDIRAQGYPDATVEDLAVFLRPSDDKRMVSDVKAPVREAPRVKAKAKPVPKKQNGAKKTRHAPEAGSTLRQLIAEAASGFGEDEFGPEQIVQRLREKDPAVKPASIKRTMGTMAGAEIEHVSRGRYRFRRQGGELTGTAERAAAPV